MSVFSYNSYHKLITVFILIIWSIIHFSNKEKFNNYDNGQVRKIGHFVNGKNDGLWTWYYENGQKKMEGHFENGKRTGLWITYDFLGRKVIQSQYKNDQLNGEFIRWDSQGNILKNSYYKSGARVE